MKFLILKVTDRCNLNCKYCYSLNKNNEDMKFRIAKKAINYLLNFDDNIKIQFTGGEPLLNFKLIEKVVNYTEDKGNFRYAIQTNGTLLGNYVEEIKELGINVGVSIDGLEVNDELRPYKDGRCSTLDTIKGIYLLEKYDIPFGVTIVVTNKNLPYLEEFVGYLIAVGVKSFSFDLLKPKKREDLKLMPNIREFEKVLNNLSKYPVYIKNLYQRKDNYCFLNKGDLLFVNEIGDIYPCPTLEGYFYMGNIKNFNGELFKAKSKGCFAREYLYKKLLREEKLWAGLNI
ncbi:radical SAM protein [Methanocaldococcus villosus KIN24-T80]|uniref:Radical SAM protein n=1 Tax=Methanocaldococcus villosus KIN24-T80 TaxID=1069083 RepID=N6UV65_9EURY|nr:radical SAM protein [Methanocaldococcus villosus]ENN96254.1 radical SAM protein [Methanocaldococcus villosus KIN24-T80]